MNIDNLILIKRELKARNKTNNKTSSFINRPFSKGDQGEDKK